MKKLIISVNILLFTINLVFCSNPAFADQKEQVNESDIIQKQAATLADSIVDYLNSPNLGHFKTQIPFDAIQAESNKQATQFHLPQFEENKNIPPSQLKKYPTWNLWSLWGDHKISNYNFLLSILGIPISSGILNGMHHHNWQPGVLTGFSALAIGFAQFVIMAKIQYGYSLESKRSRKLEEKTYKANEEAKKFYEEYQKQLYEGKIEAYSKQLKSALFKSLEARGLPIPSKNREAWLDTLLQNPSRDFIRLKSIKEVKAEIERFKKEAQNLISDISDENQKAVIEGIIDSLPGNPGFFKSIFSARNWRAEAIRVLALSKANFQKFAAEFNFEEIPGFNLSKIILGDSNLGLDLIQAANPETHRMLEIAGSSILSPNLAEIDGSKLKLEIKPIVAISEGVPVGIAEMSGDMEVVLGEKTEKISFNFRFPTRQSSTEKIIEEGNWKDALSESIDTSLKQNTHVHLFIQERSKKNHLRFCQEDLLKEKTLTNKAVEDENLAILEHSEQEQARLKIKR